MVIAATDLPGTDHGQHIYVFRCGSCIHEYGSNGSNNFQRKCPKCQGGRPGLDYSATRLDLEIANTPSRSLLTSGELTKPVRLALHHKKPPRAT